MIFVGVTTMTAAWLNIKNIYMPQLNLSATRVPGMINLILTLCIIVCVVIIIFNAVPKWIKAARQRHQAAGNSLHS